MVKKYIMGSRPPPLRTGREQTSLSMPPDTASAIVCQALHALAPDSLLTLGATADVRVQAFRTDHPDCRVTHLGALNSPRQLPAPARHGAVYLDQVLENMALASGRQLISALRNHYSPELVVLAGPSADGSWTTADFLAMGFRIAGRSAEYAVFHYSLRAYKATPDWLNSRYWAHPERFDKFRW